ncbi:hypothetical protein [Streptomyces sp. NPDC047315]|uniref:hypothetical protein n=1 Tax=Streptomyces sp. NPDC047315 TaxID=3155142 RepID=UPI0033CB5695
MPNPPDVTVTKDNPLNVTDAEHEFGTVTVEPQGQIFVYTEAKVSITSLVVKS